jgi:Protein of unknown function (DUF2917)
MRAQIKDLDLIKNSIWAMTTGPSEIKVVCLQGALWVTTGNDSKDYILKMGEELTICGKGRLVLQSLENSKVYLVLKSRKMPVAFWNSQKKIKSAYHLG